VQSGLDTAGDLRKLGISVFHPLSLFDLQPHGAVGGSNQDDAKGLQRFAKCTGCERDAPLSLLDPTAHALWRVFSLAFCVFDLITPKKLKRTNAHCRSTADVCVGMQYQTAF